MAESDRGHVMQHINRCTPCLDLVGQLGRSDSNASEGAPGRCTAHDLPSLLVRSPPPTLAPRYRILDRLGQGGMGVVYRVLDCERGEEVALKTLLKDRPSDIQQLKNEFRRLADVLHPNLALLLDLGMTDDQWYFTMELVRGQDLRSAVRGEVGGARRLGPLADPAPLCEALAQVVSGLSALHERNLLHRDIKPSNILLTAEGRAVILDFGLVTEFDPTHRRVFTDEPGAGTVAYIAPELLRRHPPTPAADWYSLGVVLYEALTGALPFWGTPSNVMADKLAHPPIAPIQRCPETPPHLDELCMALLRRRPAERPGSEEILAALRADGAAPRRRGPSASPFVGRGNLLEQLRSALAAARAGHPVLTRISGPSGIGKSSLIRRFLQEAQQQTGVMVLESRCYQHDSIAYKAIDPLIDQLRRHLLGLPADEVAALWPADGALLCQTFPVLAGLLPHAAVQADLGAHERRRRMFAALRELLQHLSERTALILSIDDLQWGDIDSVALLRELLRAREPLALLLIIAYREEDRLHSAPLQVLLQAPSPLCLGGEERAIVVPALGTEDATLLASLLISADRPVAAELTRAIARESAGSPLLVHEMVRHAHGSGAADVLSAFSLEAVLRTRLAALPEEALRLLHVLVLHGRPVGLRWACRAAEVKEPSAALAALRAAHLVRLRSGLGSDDEQIEPVHDRIREGILSQLPPAVKQARHLRLAQTLRQDEEADPAALATHLAAAGDLDQASLYALLAADRATAALAFDRAAALYRQALAHATGLIEPWALRAKLAAALGHAGLSNEAASEFTNAAALLDKESRGDERLLHLRSAAAEHALRSGHIDEGLAGLRKVLETVGMRLPRSQWGALLALLWSTLWISLRGRRHRPRAAADIPPTTLLKLDACWAAALGLSTVDALRSADLQLRHLLLALRAGEDGRVARGLAVEGILLASLGGARRRRKSAVVLTRALDLARSLGDPAVTAVALVCRGGAAFFSGEWRRGVELLDEAEHIARGRCSGATWEVATAQGMALWCLSQLGALDRVTRRLPALLDEATDWGDVYTMTNFRIGQANLAWLATDSADEASRQVDEGMRMWSQGNYLSQHYFALLARVHISLYRGDAPGAARQLAADWPRLRASQICRVQYIRIEAHHLRARCALALAVHRGGADPALLQKAWRAARLLGRERMLWAASLGRLLEAAVYTLSRRPEAARAALREAEAGFTGAEMALYACATRMALSSLEQGAAGAVRCGAEAERMRALGVKNPRAMAALFAPGFSIES